MKTLWRILTISLLVALTFSISACNSYDKKTAITRAKEYIDMLNARDYQAVYDSFPENMANMYTLEDYQTRYDLILESTGAFVKYTSTKTFMGSYVTSGESIGDYDSFKDYENAQKTDSAPKYKYIYVIITAKHETGTVTYTIVLTTDMALAELTFIQKPVA